jgi:hypothetical protein
MTGILAATGRSPDAACRWRDVGADARAGAPGQGRTCVTKRIEIVAVESGARAVAELCEEDAPKTCEAMWQCLETPMEAEGILAMFVGRELFFIMPPENQRVNPETIPMWENETSYPLPGDVMFCYFSPHRRREPWKVLPHNRPFWDLMIMYGPDTISSGGSATVWARIIQGLGELAAEAGRIRTEGTKLFRVSRLDE